MNCTIKCKLNTKTKLRKNYNHVQGNILENWCQYAVGQTITLLKHNHKNGLSLNGRDKVEETMGFGRYLYTHVHRNYSK